MRTILKNRQLLINLLLGIGLISIPFLTSPDLNKGLDLLSIPPFLKSLLSYVLLLVFFYINYYYFIPQFYLKKKWVALVVQVTVCYLIIYFLPDILVQASAPPEITPNSTPLFKSSRPEEPLPKRHLFSMGSYFFQFAMIFFLSLHLRINNYLKDIKSEQLKTEISYLKAQINPHFLFNTLNSIYALSLKKSDNTPKAILKLSNIMRYVVTESEQKKVPLQDEINYINDYIDLQKLRSAKNVIIDFNIKGETNGLNIAPLLLITFVENAFKYGIFQDENSKIAINLLVTNNKTLKFTVNNKKLNGAISKEESTQEGLKNTKKRLDYIYPNSHKLVIINTNKTYTVHLDIQLK